MKRSISTLLIAISLVALLSACESLGERAKGLSRPSYSDYKNAKKPSPEEIGILMAECPRPNGVFLNDAQEKGGIRLDRYFKVPGFQMPATSLPGGTENDEPLPAAASPIDILSRENNETWQKLYHPHPSERFTLELRPLGQGRFRIGVKSSLGLSGEAEGYLSLSGERKRCENGVLKAFWRNYDKIVPGWELYVEPATGDIVMVYNNVKERGEISYRFKRIAN